MFKKWWLVVIFAIFSINQYFHTCVSGPAQVTVQSRVWRPPWPYFLLCKELRLSAPLLFHLQTGDILVREASNYYDGGGEESAYFESLKLWSRPPFPQRLNSAQWPKKTSFKPNKYQRSNIKRQITPQDQVSAALDVFPTATASAASQKVLMLPVARRCYVWNSAAK